MRLHPRLLRTCLSVIAVLLACVPVLSAPASNTVSWLPVVDIANGGGAKGPWRQDDSRYDYVDDGTVAFMPGGGLAVAWVDQRRKEVLLQVFKPGAHAGGAPVDISRSPATFSWMPRIAADGPDTLHLLWQEIIFSGGSHGGDILYARSTDGGRSFSPPANLSSSLGGDGKGRLDRDTWSNGSLDLAVGPEGKVYAVWTEYDGALWLARSRDGGRSFMPPQRIAGDDARPARGPSLALGGGKVYLAWAVGEDPDADIHVSRSADEGAGFAPPVLVGAKGARADAQGRVHVAWESAQGLRHTWDAGAGFIAPVTVPHSGPNAGGRMGSQQGLLGKKLAAGDGMVALVNSGLLPGRGSRVCLMRGRQY